jgi:hypothetical protein
MIDLLSKNTDSVTVTDALGVDHVLPSFPWLVAEVTSLTDDLTGAVAQARDINSQTVFYSNEASKSADAAAASAVQAQESAANMDESVTDSADSAAAAAASANIASSYKDAAKVSADAADASKVAAKTSETASKSNMDNAGFSATAAQGYRDDAQLARDMSSAYANAPVNTEVTPGQYSAFHWAEQARLTAVGAVVYRGSWDASAGMPIGPKLGDFYFISKAGTVNSVKYSVGDMIVFDGTLWERIDNQQTVTSVAGRTGAVVIGWSDVGSKPTTLSGYGITDAIWTSSNFDPTTKANLAGATFTGAVVVNNSSLRASGWGGTTTDGVVYFGGGDSYIYKGGSNFTFKNEQGNFTATLSSGGTVWTSNNITPLDKNTGGTISGKADFNGQVNCWSGFHSVGSSTAFNGQGAYVGWNRNYSQGNGETDFINHKGGGSGGFAFYNTDGSTYTEVAAISGSGSFYPAGDVWLQNQSVERHYGWQFNDRSCYLYGNPSSKDIGLYDSTGVGRWRTDTSGNFYANGTVSGSALSPSSSAGGNITGNGSGMQWNGAYYLAGTGYYLWANSAGWTRMPRMFVQGNDPGGAAFDGDLWIW